MTKFSIAISLVAIACSGAQKKSDDIQQDPVTFEDPPETAKPKPAAEPHLTIDKISIVVAPGQQIELGADGKVVFGGNHVATVRTDGTMVHPNGSTLAKLKKDGTLTELFNKNPILTKIVFDDGGTVSLEGGKQLAVVAEDGTVTAGGQTIKLEGPAGARRAAMFVFIIATMPNDPNAKPPEDAPANPCGGATKEATGNPCGG